MSSSNGVADADTETPVGYGGAEKITGLPRPTLRWLVHEKRIPHVRVGPRLVLFHVSELRAWLEAHACRPTSVRSGHEHGASDQGQP